MANNEYHNAFDMVLDWRDAQEHELSPEQHQEIANAEAEIAAYTGRMYSEIRHDVARCAVARLTAMQPAETNNVTQLRPSRKEVFAATRYVAVSSPVSRG